VAARARIPEFGDIHTQENTGPRGRHRNTKTDNDTDGDTEREEINGDNSAEEIGVKEKEIIENKEIQKISSHSGLTHHYSRMRYITLCNPKSGEWAPWTNITPNGRRQFRTRIVRQQRTNPNYREESGVVSVRHNQGQWSPSLRDKFERFLNRLCG